jgi:hypothetical protein
MREYFLPACKGLLLLAVLALVAFLIVLRIGSRRGTRAYRWRMALWQVALLLASGALLLGPLALAGCKKGDDPVKAGSPTRDRAEDSCYKPGPPSEREEETQQSPPGAGKAAAVGPGPGGSVSPARPAPGGSRVDVPGEKRK